MPVRGSSGWKKSQTGAIIRDISTRQRSDLMFDSVSMRRGFASFLLALLSFPLIAPAWVARAGSSLPSCCRRNGQHRCKMGSLDSDAETIDKESTSDSAVNAIRLRCPYCPAALTIRAGSNVALVQDQTTTFLPLFSHLAAKTHEARYRVSFNQSRQERGPPAPIS
jgi:hypothetical protein